MLKQAVGTIFILFLKTVNLSEAELQYPYTDSNYESFPEPYSSLIDTKDVKHSFNFPFQVYPKVLDGEEQEEQEESIPDAGGRFFWTIYVTQTRARPGFLTTSYCTTSTTAISICTPSGRRRKRFSKGFRGLFFEEQHEGGQTNMEDNSALLLHNISAEK